jgi:hypothetical protein
MDTGRIEMANAN